VEQRRRLQLVPVDIFTVQLMDAWLNQHVLLAMGFTTINAFSRLQHPPQRVPQDTFIVPRMAVWLSRPVSLVTGYTTINVCMLERPRARPVRRVTSTVPRMAVCSNPHAHQDTVFIITNASQRRTIAPQIPVRAHARVDTPRRHTDVCSSTNARAALVTTVDIACLPLVITITSVIEYAGYRMRASI